MNNRFLGNASCLTKYELLLLAASTNKLPVWYISMLTEPEPRNKGDKNATNYRLGSKNTRLHETMKNLYYGDDGTINEVSELLREQGVNLKMIAIRNNQKAGHYRIGYINHFNHKDRVPYFEGVASLIEKEVSQIIFLDPDTGVNPSSRKLGRAKGHSFATSAEVKSIMDIINDESIIMIQQQLTNYQYSHEARVKDLLHDLQTNIILVVDEVIQSGVYFIVKSRAQYDSLVKQLWIYLAQYQFVKSNDRVMVISGNMDGITTKSLTGTMKSTNAAEA